MLVCEDAIGYRMLIRRWLEDAGVEVVGEAPTWTEAERLAGELQPDAVVADLWMPTLDVDALRRVRAAVPDASIVSLSGLSAEDAERLVGDAAVQSARIVKFEEGSELRGVERGAFAEERAAKLAATSAE